MKYKLLLFALLFLTFREVTATEYLPLRHLIQRFETQNMTDSSGRRQGYWKITGSMSVEEGYKATQVIEEGNYIDNKREGIWKKYYPTGALQSEITYQHNHPFGAYKTFYPNGNIEEEGFWRTNKNTGGFKRYHENGKPAQEFSFNTYGKRNGVQKYYYPNGRLQLEVEVENGVAHGFYKSYYPDGTLREKKRITNGEVEPGSVEKHQPASLYKEIADVPELPRTETIPIHEDRPNLEEFKETGFNTLYNRNKQLSQVGEFVNGRLTDGKWYKYDENGLLKKVEVYKEGRFIGYGIIEDSNN